MTKQEFKDKVERRLSQVGATDVAWQDDEELPIVSYRLNGRTWKFLGNLPNVTGAPSIPSTMSPDQLRYGVLGMIESTLP
jgi:hypothetical protein